MSDPRPVALTGVFGSFRGAFPPMVALPICTLLVVGAVELAGGQPQSQCLLGLAERGTGQRGDPVLAQQRRGQVRAGVDRPGGWGGAAGLQLRTEADQPVADCQ